MKLKFKSIAQQNGEQNIVEFEAETTVEQTEFKDLYDSEVYKYTTLTFIDPQNKKATRIEFNPKRINMLNDFATLEFRLNELSEYSKINVNGNNFGLKTLLTNYEFNELNHNFEYKLFSMHDDPMGEFKIFIELFE